MKSKINSHTQRVLEWIRDYPGWWYLICTPGAEEMNLQMLRLLIQKLSQAHLYDLVFVLLMVHREHPALQKLAEYWLIDRLSATWEDDKGQILEELSALLE